MRDNEDRIGSKAKQSDPPIQDVAEAAAKSNSSPLSFVAPTEFVNLPSRGKFYPDGHPLKDQETVELKMMTTKQEDILTSRSLLKKGVAIDRFLQSLIVTPGIKTGDLLIGDKNALLVAARISGYGSDYETQVTCPVCQERSSWTFALEDYTTAESAELKELEGVSLSEQDGQTVFIIELPHTGWKVGCKPLFGNDESQIAKTSQQKKKAGLPESALTDQLKSLMVSIEGRTDAKTVNEAIAVMPAKDSRHLRETYKQLIPNIDMTQEFVCTHCQYETEMEVPLAAEFFWPKS